MKIEIYGLALLSILAIGAAPVRAAENAALQSKCGGELQKVVACLNFVTGKAAEPGKQCCDSASSINASDRPVCFCYIIEQVHSGDNSQVQSLGIQEARLLQLPSACKINDVNVTNCPKLLNLPANSPDVAFFTNTTTSANNASITAPASPSSTTSTPASNAFSNNPRIVAHIPVALAIFFFTLFKMF